MDVFIAVILAEASIAELIGVADWGGAELVELVELMGLV